MSNHAPCVGATAATRVDDRSGEDAAFSPDRVSKLDFAEFYAHELGRLVQFVRSRVGDEQAAEDVVADTMMVVLKRWDDLGRWIDDDGDMKRLRSYAFGVARNLASDLNKKRQRYFLVGGSESLKPLIEEPSDSCIDMLDVQRTLAQLPDRQSQVLWMDIQGFTTAEIARKMHVRESTARTHLASARRHMREQLYKVFTGCNA